MPKQKNAAQPVAETAPWIEDQRRAIELVKGGQPSEAMKIYEDLEHKYPDDPKVLIQLVNAYYNMGYMSKYEQSIRRLVELEGPKVDSLYGLGGAYVANSRQGLALQTYRNFIQRWPEDEHADQVKKNIATLEQELIKRSLNLDVSIELGLDLFVLADEARYYIDHNQLDKARSTVKKLLRLKRNFGPGLETLIQIDAQEGRIKEAINTAERLLAQAPGNLQTLNTLVRLNFLSGHEDKARRYATLLQNAPRNISGSWTLIAEALAFLEDDQAMLALAEEAKDHKAKATPAEDAGFYHLAAVSAWHLGLEDQARSFWNQALQASSYFGWANENMRESIKPPEERGAIWAFPFDYWLLGPVFDQITELLKKVSNIRVAHHMMQRFLDETHPELLSLAPHLLSRGDAQSRDFVIRLTAVSAHPGLVDQALGFVLGQSCPYGERLAFAQILVEAGVLPRGTSRLWDGHQWIERLILPIQVEKGAPAIHFSPETAELATKASQALYRQDGAEAQAFLEKALELTPDDALIMNNLVLAYELQGKEEEARALRQDVFKRFPGNFFANIGMARQAIEDNDLAYADSLLSNLERRHQLHITEFAALCMVEMESSLAKADQAKAGQWLELWERYDPQNESLPDYRKMIRRRKTKKK